MAPIDQGLQFVVKQDLPHVWRSIHYGYGHATWEARQGLRDSAFEANPNASKAAWTRPSELPTAGWINPPTTEKTDDQSIDFDSKFMAQGDAKSLTCSGGRRSAPSCSRFADSAHFMSGGVSGETQGSVLLNEGPVLAYLV